ncbi:bifunctional indole-3-glycerol-phosphate synthase TrpC/phosphoribosylanthranilate isomerase TrpF [Shewanella sp. NIFS-20-20]|uniref:bifunctional indole-3-glycerol-phosphate synthase TrpC/phosphoribosylanthranilate isomerase TrpF n=1 Tax=Shewanella sp. NIFS-20-20 TaxID=2853806 RepID=UPI001C442FFD|nr:bifunctional indole-3-glycerol-phosphate synthase TrpC/phosphoribosylanthranilate isomerase TrpF [Shewanella sp. NIFS-20-20]MBV7315040.1 bifunctional indole-3-glycerol-phosphate synthase TrpC/phosphoribosylanthranilate isomerase TrpF [Shewanella sp. NIFS-20-20]
MSNILTQIVETKHTHIAQLQQRFPAASLQPQTSTRSLYQALRQGPASFILECKKASPSKGLIRDDFDIDAIARVYGRHASAVSVLTDEQWFQGDMAYIPQVKALIPQPILCKDFFISPYQVMLAAHQGADAILLMLSVLNDQQYLALAAVAADYQLDILTEVSNRQELDRALGLNAKIIGINNRNLRDLSTDLATTEQLAPLIPADAVVISESGIYHHQDVRRLAPLVQGFLVGSSLMAEANLDQACRALIYGENKICGLTRAQDLEHAANAGSLYGGLIFAPSSPRAVTLEHAAQLAAVNQQLVQPLKLVGVFVNAPLPQMMQHAQQLGLSAIQLHGDETDAAITALKQALTEANLACEIWQAIGVATDIQQLSPSSQADRIVYDSRVANQFGGTGVSFDWQRSLPRRSAAMLAGGLNAENAHQAAAAGFKGLDFNSGLESQPGIKDKNKIFAAFAQLRQY